MSRLFAIGDVHGCRIQLEHLFGLLKPTTADTVVMLGDYVDRGPDSKGVIDLLQEMQGTTNLVCLRGNHEVMMLEARLDLRTLEFWCSVGGAEALDSYGSKTLDGIPVPHWTFLEETVPYVETDTHFFVHANAYPDLPLAEQPDDMLYWERFGGPPHQSGKVMVCGHTSQKNGLPKSLGHAICIDTHGYESGWLTALEPATGQYWQVNPEGTIRTDHISAHEA